MRFTVRMSRSASSSLTIRVDSDIKEAAKGWASQLGITLSALIENDLRQFISGRPVVINEDSYVPAERLRASIAQAEAEHERGETVVAPAAEVQDYLDQLKKTKGA
jgi:antitoxin component of RelBE/YafQ-DinJ toxin-antitoxin module